LYNKIKNPIALMPIKGSSKRLSLIIDSMLPINITNLKTGLKKVNVLILMQFPKIHLAYRNFGTQQRYLHCNEKNKFDIKILFLLL
jgi:hypothetical protein